MKRKEQSAHKVDHPKTIEAFLEQQSKQDLLRFITCGSVDDGKSTLIGRLLWDAQQLFDDQLASLQADSKKYGTQGENIDFALLVDGLAAEREQGITIDVAYRFFATSKRKFIVADTPGHEQYTRNMITGASTASVAILLVDARAGLMTQTRRHAFLNSLVGIRHVVLAVNKLDLVDYKQSVFDSIREAFEAFAKPLGFTSITAVPISALKGDNITTRSAKMPWYKGPTLMGYLETIDPSPQELSTAAFPVQWVNRPNSEFRGFSGSVLQGEFKVGDTIRVTSTGQTARIREIVTMDGLLTEASAGETPTLVLDAEIDASRGDVLSLADKPLETTDQFEAQLVWMHEDEGLAGRSYELKLCNQWSSATLTRLKYKTNVNTLGHEPTASLSLNDIGLCQISLSRPLVYGVYKEMHALGCFILVDKLTNATVAAGMIKNSLRRAQNVHKQKASITTLDRERLNGHTGKVIWFTGLSGSGKSTISNALEVELHQRGLRTYMLDGDNVRLGLNRDLGFSEADRIENIRRVAEVAKLMADAGLVVMTAFISPYRRDRAMARELIGKEHFVEVFIDTPLTICESRDVKGLYAKARQGEIPNFTGINSPYESPTAAQFVIKTEKISVEKGVQLLVEGIFSRTKEG
ncbi:MAG: sulfate adenylyltransferase subunit CysN [Proteobacteria bacterium]|nr:sulfate adenylyltransferase subunit CysN [Pseudomonadota bacterium]